MKHVPSWVHSARFANWNADTFSLTRSQAEEKAASFAKSGINAVILFWRGRGKEYRHIVFDNVLFGKGYDFNAMYRVLEEIVKACHKYGIKVVEHHGIAFVHHDLKSDLYQKTIDCMHYKGMPMKNWTQWDTRVQKVSMGWYRAYMFCPNNPYYREAVFTHYLPDTLATGVDGIMPDDVQLTPDWYTCGCRFCRQKFHLETGWNLSNDGSDSTFWENFENPAFRAWIRFRMKSTGDFYQDFGKSAFEIKKDLLFFACSSSDISTWSSQMCGGSYEDWIEGTGVNTVFNEVLHPYALPYNIPIIGTQMKEYQAIAREWKVPSISIFYPNSNNENYLCWSLAKSWNQLYWSCPKDETINNKTFVKWEKTHKDLFEKLESDAEIAVLFSRQTRDGYGGPEDSYYVKEWAGWCETLLANNIQFDVLLDRQITEKTLAQYRLLILPNCACLSDSQIEIIDKFVCGGGYLVASFETSLFDETGKRRENFALTNLFGVRYLKTLSEVSIPVVINIQDRLTEGLEKRFANREPSVFVEVSKKNVRTLLRLRTEHVTFERPFLTEHLYGKGTVFYCSGKPGLMRVFSSIFFQANSIIAKVEHNLMPGYDTLMFNIIRAAFPQGFAIEWENLPEGIFVTTAKKGTTHIVHLVNAVGTSLPDGSMVISPLSLKATNKWLHTDFVNDIDKNLRVKTHRFTYRSLSGDDVVCILPNKVKNARLISPQIPETSLSVHYNERGSSIKIPIQLIKRYAVLHYEADLVA